MLDAHALATIKQQAQENRVQGRTGQGNALLRCPLCPCELKPLGKGQKTLHCGQCGHEFEITAIDL